MPGPDASIGDGVEVDLGDVDLGLRGDVARRCQRRQRAGRSRRPVGARSRRIRTLRRGRGRGTGDRPAVNSRATPSPDRDQLDGALHVEEVDRRGRCRSSAPGDARADPREPQRAALAAVRGEDRAQLEQPHVVLSAAPVVGDGIDHARAAATAAAPRTAPRAGSGFRRAAVPRRTSAPPARSMNENVTPSAKPAAAARRRTSRSRSSRRSGSAGVASSAGNVVGRRS